MTKPRISTIVLGAFSVLLAVMAFVCLWAAYSLLTANPPVMDKGATALGVSGAIALGLWNAWHLWAKERKESKAGLVATVYFAELDNMPVLQCRVENQGKLDAWVENLQIDHLCKEIPAHFTAVNVNEPEGASGYRIPPNYRVLFSWHIAADEAYRCGIHRVIVVPANGKPMAATCPILQRLKTLYLGAKKNKDGIAEGNLPPETTLLPSELINWDKELP